MPVTALTCARKSWSHYPRPTQSRLVVRALDPITLALKGVAPMEHQQHLSLDTSHDHSDNNPGTAEDGGSGSGNAEEDAADVNLDVLLPQGCFLIGNHADELTPWMAPLATLVQASGYLS